MINSGCTYTDRITKKTADQTVLDYYDRRYTHSSREEWCDRIHNGQIQLNGKAVLPETLIKSGQILTYDRPPWEEPDVPLTFEVCYEDEDLVVIIKPSGLPVLPGGGFLENTLLQLLARSYEQNPPIPIHRLGRGTSGLMILARTPLAKAQLTKQMCDRQIKKIYLALASGIVERDRIGIHQPVGKVAHPVLGYLFAASADGLVSESHLEVLERRADSTLCAVEIFTGRPHQIRIHTAFIGHPLVGDPLYAIGGIAKLDPPKSPLVRGTLNSRGTLNGVERPDIAVPGACGYHLHAHRLSFSHPRSQTPLTFTAPPSNPLLNLQATI
jgi:23S rRNA pseudouridine1911/1915/1917 synthase